MADHFKLDITNRGTRITIFNNVADDFAEEYRTLLTGDSNTSKQSSTINPSYAEILFQNIQVPPNTPITKPTTKKTSNKPISAAAGKYAVYNYNKRLKFRSSQFRTDAYMNFRVPNVQFVTLTFDPKTFERANDLDSVHNAFKKFIQRIHYQYSDFVYLATFSRQKQTGNWHYHMLCNFDMDVSNKYIQDKWSYGIVDSTPLITHTEFSSCISYCIDNMYQVAWDELHAEKGYLKSKGLIKRVTLRSWNELEADNAYDYLSKILGSTDKPLDSISKEFDDTFSSGKKVQVSYKYSHKLFPELFTPPKVATKKTVCI